MWHVPAVILAVSLSVAAPPSFADSPTTEPTTNSQITAGEIKNQPAGLTIGISSLSASSSCDVYFGDGPALQPHNSSGQKGDPWLFMVKGDDGNTYGYQIVTLHTNGSHDLLTVQVTLKNISSQNVDCQPFNFALDSKDAALVALGTGDMAFAKSDEWAKKIKTDKTYLCKPGADVNRIYVFDVSRNDSNWSLTYLGKKLCDLNRVNSEANSTSTQPSR